MSRIGKIPIAVPKGVDVKIENDSIDIKGAKGSQTIVFKDHVKVEREGEEIRVISHTLANQDRAYQGLYQRLIANAVLGVSNGFSKELHLIGVGYRAEVKGKELALRLGYSHDINVPTPDGIVFTTPDPTKVVISGADKQQVGQVAANIRKLRPPEPYKGKGVRYSDEVVRRKEGKSAAK